MSKLKIGWAETNITPDKPMALAGQFAERISQYVEKPLTATAMAIEADGEQAVLCEADLVNVSYPLFVRIKEAIGDRAPGLDPDKIIISAIHTHTGPISAENGKNKTSKFSSSSFRGLLESYLPEGMEYVEKENISNNTNIASREEVSKVLTEKISEAIVTAWNNRKDGSFINAFGRAAVGMCRRAAYSDGSAQMWGNTDTAVFKEIEGGNDSGIELLYVFDETKKLKGIVANLACPAQCVQHRLFVSPDFWGEAKMLLRNHFGEDIFLLPLCSAAGDQCPVDLVRWVEPESPVNDPNIEREGVKKRKADPSMFDIAGMKKVGKRIANEIIEVYNEGLDDAIDTAEFKHKVLHMQLPLRRATLEQKAKAEREIELYLSKKDKYVDYNDAAKLQVHLGILKRMNLQDIVDVVDTEVHIIKLGNIAIATNPFELFLDYGNQIKARSAAEQTFLIQLACGSEGYLPTEKAENGGHYSAFVSSGQIGHQGGDQLVRETLSSINSMFE